MSIGKAHVKADVKRSKQFRNDHRPLHAIANGAKNHRAGVGTQRDSKAIEYRAEN